MSWSKVIVQKAYELQQDVAAAWFDKHTHAIMEMHNACGKAF